MIFGPLHRISPSSAIFTSTFSINVPTVPNILFFGFILFTLITGDVSVKPYPSNIGTLAAVNTLNSLTWQAAEPVTIAFTFAPNASLHLLKINLLAMPNWRLYQIPWFLLISYFNPRSRAQLNNFFLVPVSVAAFAIIRS